MRLPALLILTVAVVRARAATIPDHIVPELEKKLSEAVQEVLVKDALTLKDELNDQELLDQVNAVDNAVPESGPLVKTEDGSTDIERPAVDLNNPGLPQVQRHDYQNPEVFGEAKLKESSVSQSAAETKNVLHEGLIDITQKVQGPALNEEKILLVQQSIDELQKNFSNHLRQLNEVIKKYSEVEGPGGLRTVGVVEQDSTLTSDLKKVQTEFDSGIQSLSEGVAHLKADGDNTVATPAPPFNFIQSFTGLVNNLYTSFQNNLANVNTAVQNAFNNTQGNTPAFLQGPLNVINNVIRPQQQQQQQQQLQQPGFITNVINTVQGWWSPTTSASPQTQAPASSVAVTPSITNSITEESKSTTPNAVEATKNAEGAAEKGHGGGQGSEHSDNSNGLVAEVASTDNKNYVTEQPELAPAMETENSDNKEKPTEQDNIELTTTVEELQKSEESVTEIGPLVLVRSNEENVESGEVKTEEPKTELPTMKEETTTVLIDLMMNDEAKVEVMYDEPKVEDRISSDTSIHEDFKIETTALPSSAEEIPTTEAGKEMFITGGILSLMNSPAKEIAEPEVSGTAISEIDVVTEKEEQVTNVESMKVEEPMTTLNPLVQVEDRNQEPPVTEVEIKKIEEEGEEGRTTERPSFEEQVLNLEVSPVKEIKNDETVNDLTTEVPKVEENKEGKKEIKRRVVRRLIKRTLL